MIRGSADTSWYARDKDVLSRRSLCRPYGVRVRVGKSVKGLVSPGVWVSLGEIDLRVRARIVSVAAVFTAWRVCGEVWVWPQHLLLLERVDVLRLQSQQPRRFQHELHVPATHATHMSRMSRGQQRSAVGVSSSTNERR
eukprot:9499876-Pyramimonas_sp.AAC.2